MPQISKSVRQAPATQGLPTSREQRRHAEKIVTIGTKRAPVVLDSVDFGQSSALRDVSVTKSNFLIEATYSLTLQEQRLVLACIAHIDPRLPLDEQRVFRIQATEFQARFGLHREKAYSELKMVSDRLWGREVFIEDPATGVIEKYRWTSKIKYVKGQGAVTLHFAPEILPFLSQLKDRFTSYSLEAVAGFTSTFAIRLYELLGQYRGLGRRTTAIADLRRWLDCGDSFERFCDFERWAIGVAVDQINLHSDLRVQYRKIKQGRTISHIEFLISRAEPVAKAVSATPTKTRAPPSESAEENRVKWEQQMKDYGLDVDRVNSAACPPTQSQTD